MTTTTAPATECRHGMEAAWCAICRREAGYRPGSDRQRNDCTVVALAHLTGATYDEAVEMLAVQGREAGQGAHRSLVREALAAAGWATHQPAVSIAEALVDGGSYYVSAQRGKVRHGFAIVAGQVHNDLGWLARGGFRYQIFAVVG
jgi:hypothetical protein